jgi:hypothetical protein
MLAKPFSPIFLEGSKESLRLSFRLMISIMKVRVLPLRPHTLTEGAGRVDRPGKTGGALNLGYSNQIEHCYANSIKVCGKKLERRWFKSSRPIHTGILLGRSSAAEQSFLN